MKALILATIACLTTTAALAGDVMTIVNQSDFTIVRVISYPVVPGEPSDAVTIFSGQITPRHSKSIRIPKQGNECEYYVQAFNQNEDSATIQGWNICKDSGDFFVLVDDDFSGETK